MRSHQKKERKNCDTHLEVLDHEIVDNHGIASSAKAQSITCGLDEAELFGPSRADVRKGQYLMHVDQTTNGNLTR